jgi:hypothetical protein
MNKTAHPLRPGRRQDVLGPYHINGVDEFLILRTCGIEGGDVENDGAPPNSPTHVLTITQVTFYNLYIHACQRTAVRGGAD